jgi:hypothetical protein
MTKTMGSQFDKSNSQYLSNLKSLKRAAAVVERRNNTLKIRQDIWIKMVQHCSRELPNEA